MANSPSFTPRDFGKAAADYGAFRNGFPPSFFERLIKEGVGAPGQRILDLGTGTGTLARGFAARGAFCVGLDITPELLEQVPLPCVRAKAEAAPFKEGSFDVVSAGQCWHWFDGPAAAAECRRLLKPGGTLAVCHLCYLPRKGEAAGRTEDLILKVNPHWPFAGTDGRYERWRAHLEPAGFQDIRSFYYDEDVPFTHEGWRGRIRACNGVLALQAKDSIAAFDRELEAMLKSEFPSEPLLIPHRVFVIRARRP